jgi:hypothetical protein
VRVCLQEEEDGKQEREKRNKLFGTYGEKNKEEEGKKEKLLTNTVTSLII